MRFTRPLESMSCRGNTSPTACKHRSKIRYSNWQNPFGDVHSRRETSSKPSDYLQNRTTANQAIEVFNQAVREGTRAGIIRSVSIPCLRREGLHLARVQAGRNAGIRRSRLTLKQFAQVKCRRARYHKTIRELAAEYHVSTDVILRALRLQTACTLRHCSLTRFIRRNPTTSSWPGRSDIAVSTTSPKGW